MKLHKPKRSSVKWDFRYIDKADKFIILKAMNSLFKDQKAILSEEQWMRAHEMHFNLEINLDPDK